LYGEISAADISLPTQQSLANQQRVSDQRALAVFDKQVIKGFDRKSLQGSVPLDCKNFEGSKAIGVNPCQDAPRIVRLLLRPGLPPPCANSGTCDRGRRLDANGMAAYPPYLMGQNY